jgi:hypothetical protein
MLMFLCDKTRCFHQGIYITSRNRFYEDGTDVKLFRKMDLSSCNSYIDEARTEKGLARGQNEIIHASQTWFRFVVKAIVPVRS